MPLARCLAVSSSRLNFFGGYKVKSSRDRFEAGGRIGIETMVYEEKHILAELISFYSKFNSFQGRLTICCSHEFSMSSFALKTYLPELSHKSCEQ